MSYGLLGKTLQHSFSPQIHQKIGDYSYQLFEVAPDDLPRFFEASHWQGINVTIPYKEAVMDFCDTIDDKARRIGCVNTIVRQKDGTLFGTNTDYDGFLFSLHHAGINVENKKCLILGNGATSKTIRTVLTDEGAREILNIARHDGIPYDDIHLHHDAEIIINATPVGMYPDTPKALIQLEGFHKLEAVFDVIYNPHFSQLLLDAQKKGAIVCDGLPMLVAQAVVAANYFVGVSDIGETILPILSDMRYQTENIVLIGMPGVGKSSVGRTIARKMKRPFVDIDTVIKKAHGDIPTFIEKNGIEAFRTLESRYIAEYGKEHGQIIATGGGAILKQKNKAPLQQNGRLYWLERPLKQLATKGRPLSQGGYDTLRKLNRERRPLYQDFADRHISHYGVTRSAKIIMEDFYETIYHQRSQS